MTEAEAFRVALACTIDKARDLPRGETKERVTEAARTLYAFMRRQSETPEQRTQRFREFHNARQREEIAQENAREQKEHGE